MKTIDADVAVDTDCVLGEGPVWWDSALWFVDIEGHRVHRFSPDDCHHRTFDVPRRIGFAIPSTRYGWVIGQDASIATWRPGDENPVHRGDAEPLGSLLRFNDAKCDPTGRLYAGTMHLDAEPTVGSLFRIDAGFRAERVVGDVTISNGLAWDTELSFMYYVDTASGQIDRFRWNAETGDVDGRTPIARFADGAPDGMSIDVEGFLWVAVWGGSRVARIDPKSGREVASVRLPCPNVTSCCFGGDRHDQLWITTARLGVDEESLAAYPHAGAVFVADAAIEGRPTTPMT